MFAPSLYNMGLCVRKPVNRQQPFIRTLEARISNSSRIEKNYTHKFDHIITELKQLLEDLYYVIWTVYYMKQILLLTAGLGPFGKHLQINEIFFQLFRLTNQVKMVSQNFIALFTCFPPLYGFLTTMGCLSFAPLLNRYLTYL